MKRTEAQKKVLIRNSYVIDATGVSFGRVASRAAKILMGKHKVSYVPNRDRGDFVVIENVNTMRITGLKSEQKVYYRHSQYPGGLKGKLLKDLFSENPSQVIRHAVYNMLPKTRLRKGMMKRLLVK